MTDKSVKGFPPSWQIDPDYDPNKHLMQLKGKDYLNVQQRMLWFLRDQRAFIAAGLDRCAYAITTELVELDHDAGFAHFKTHVRDVLGNECTAYGSETARDFGDYAEKAGTKSQGRALAGLGYGTAFAPEMDEGERVVDSPVERRRGAENSYTNVNTNAPPTVRPSTPDQGLNNSGALRLEMEHIPHGASAQDVRAFAAEHGIDGPAWGQLYNERKGDLNAIWREVRRTLTPPQRALGQQTG